MKLSHSIASTSAPYVDPTSVTTAPGSAPQSSRTAPSSASTATPAIAMSAVPMSAMLATASSIAPRSRAICSASGLRFQPTTCAPSRRRAAIPTEPPMRPTPRSATLIGRRSRHRAAGPHRAREPVEHADGRLPVHAGIGDRLAVGQRRGSGRLLAPADEEGLEHDADDRPVAAGDLLADLRRDHGLALVVLAAVVVRGVDDEPL